MIDSAWSTFIRMLEYKCRQYGQVFLKVDPRRSSQTCLACGFVHSKNRKGKIFCCLHCGYTDDADINTAKVILQRGLAILKSSTAGLAGSDARGEGTDGGTAFGRVGNYIINIAV
ncbi:zinc ribbon domain-containing protein [Desulfothermus sp.]